MNRHYAKCQQPRKPGCQFGKS